MNPIQSPNRSAGLRRWIPCLAMLALSLLSYVDRSVLAILSPTILADLHMSVTQYGYALSAFSLSYMIANPVWGLWIDRRGLWIVTGVAVALWSIASGSHALMYGVGGMCLARAALGFGEGATFPAGLATVAETLPAEDRSFGLGLAYSGGSLGAMITPLLIVPIALRYGWRLTFLVTAGLGLLWILFWIGLRITGIYPTGVPPQTTQTNEFAPKAKIGWNRNLAATAALYGLGAAPLAFGLYATPLYLSRVLHLSQASLGHLLWVPPAGWEAGYLFWGKVSDRRRRLGKGRPDGLVLGLTAAGFLIALTPFAAATEFPVSMTMVLFFAQMFVAGGFVVLSLADGMSVQRTNGSGLLAGIAISSWAAVTALLTPALGHLFDRGLYTSSFWLVASLPVSGLAVWKLLRKTESVVAD